MDTTSIDNAALALEARSYFIRKAGSDGFRIGHQPTIKKVVSDRRASLDEETEVKPALRKLVEDEFRRGSSISVVPFPSDGAEIPDTPKLILIVADPEVEWSGGGSLRAQLAEWTRQRGKSPRLYPGALVWCLKKPGRDLRDKVELELAWKRVAREVAEGTLGGEFDKSDRAELQAKVKDAEVAAKDGVWGDYRFAVVADGQETDGLKVIDLGAGHSSSGETLCGRVIAALKSEALLNESVGAGYIERNWPPALKDSGAWPLASLRQSFLNGSLTRLVDPDAILKAKIVEFVARGDFGLASGQKTDGSYDRLWFEELIALDEVVFDAGVFPDEEGFGEGAQVGCSTRAGAEYPAWSRTRSSAKAGSATWTRARAWRQHEDAAPRRNGSARGLEPSRDEDSAEAALGFRPPDGPRFQCHSEGRCRWESGDRATTNPARAWTWWNSAGRRRRPTNTIKPSIFASPQAAGAPEPKPGRL